MFEFMKKIGVETGVRTRSKTRSKELVRKAFGRGLESLV
jgi:hypothetical protein